MSERRIWRDGAFHADEWQRFDAEGDMPVGGAPLLVPLALFLAEPERFAGYNGPLGVIVAPGEAVSPLAPHLPRLAMIALEFPKFSDGRNYSSARLLRERHGYEGDIRAVGDVLQDQVPLMRRCGITSFDISHAPTARALAEDRLVDVRHHYQPVPSETDVPAGTRPWARRAS